jgi:hypothetical protein
MNTKKQHIFCLLINLILIFSFTAGINFSDFENNEEEFIFQEMDNDLLSDFSFVNNDQSSSSSTENDDLLSSSSISTDTWIDNFEGSQLNSAWTKYTDTGIDLVLDNNQLVRKRTSGGSGWQNAYIAKPASDNIQSTSIEFDWYMESMGYIYLEGRDEIGNRAWLIGFRDAWVATSSRATVYLIAYDSNGNHVENIINTGFNGISALQQNVQFKAEFDSNNHDAVKLKISGTENFQTELTGMREWSEIRIAIGLHASYFKASDHIKVDSFDEAFEAIPGDGGLELDSELKELPKNAEPGNSDYHEINIDNKYEFRSQWTCYDEINPDSECYNNEYTDTFYRGVRINTNEILRPYGALDHQDIFIHIGNGFSNYCEMVGWIECEDGTDIAKIIDNPDYDVPAYVSIEVKLVQSFDPFFTVTTEPWYSQNVAISSSVTESDIVQTTYSWNFGASVATLGKSTEITHTTTLSIGEGWNRNVEPGQTKYYYHESYYLIFTGYFSFDYLEKLDDYEYDVVENHIQEFEIIYLIGKNFKIYKESHQKFGNFPDSSEINYVMKKDFPTQKEIYASLDNFYDRTDSHTVQEKYTYSFEVGGSYKLFKSNVALAGAFGTSNSEDLTVKHTFNSVNFPENYQGTAESDYCKIFNIRLTNVWEASLECDVYRETLEDSRPTLSGLSFYHFDYPSSWTVVSEFDNVSYEFRATDGTELTSPVVSSGELYTFTHKFTLEEYKFFDRYIIGVRAINEDQNFKSNWTYLYLELKDLRPSQPIFNIPSHITYLDTISVTPVVNDPKTDSIEYKIHWGESCCVTSGWINKDEPYSASFSYSSSGTYQITVTVKNEHNLENSKTITFEVNNPTPTKPEFAGSTILDVGVSGSWTVVSTQPEGKNLQYHFDFGDGTTWTSGWVSSGSSVTRSHSFSEYKTYTVKVQAYDGTEYSEWSSISVQITNLQPSAPSFYLPSSVHITEGISIIPSVSDPKSDLIMYKINFGDGCCVSSGWINKDDLYAASKSYSSIGTYTVQVTVRNEYGLESSSSKSITIYSNAPNKPSTPSGPISGDSGQSLTYSFVATDPDGDNIRYRVYWGDGTTSTSSYVSSGQSVSMSKIYSVSVGGSFEIKVRAQDEYGTWSVYSNVLTVYINGDGSGDDPVITLGTNSDDDSPKLEDSNLLLASDSNKLSSEKILSEQYSNSCTRTVLKNF